jgi:hypothetical protein
MPVDEMRVLELGGRAIDRLHRRRIERALLDLDEQKPSVAEHLRRHVERSRIHAA